MGDMRVLEADHKRAEFRQAQPLRHVAAQHAGLARRGPLPVITSTRRASRACALRRKRSSAECACACVSPCRSMRRVDRLLAARDALLHAAAERRQRRRRWFCGAGGGAAACLRRRAGGNGIAGSPSSSGVEMRGRVQRRDRLGEGRPQHALLVGEDAAPVAAQLMASRLGSADVAITRRPRRVLAAAAAAAGCPRSAPACSRPPRRPAAAA